MTNRWTSRNCNSGDGSKLKGKQNKNEIEVLFELQESRNIIKSKRSKLLEKITENAISITGQSDVQVHTLQSSRKAGSRGKQKKPYLLQRYINEWKAYVNCDSIDQVKNRDWLTITAQPSSSLPISSSTLAESAQSPQNGGIKVRQVCMYTILLLDSEI